MKVTRDVINDLLPLYHAGEASADSRALVEAFLKQDPELEKLARAARSPMSALETGDPAAPGEKEMLVRVRRILRRRSILMGVALFCSLAPFSVAGNDEGVRWFMLRDLPVVAGAFVVAALLAWIAYAWTFRSLRDV
jgi:hypothetical protein